jgi:hypothetical protein
MKNNSILYFLGGIGSFLIAFGTAQGTVQKYISFPDPLNEMGFCFFALLLSIGCFISAWPTKSTK